MKTLTTNSRKFLALKPTLIATVAGNRFYEHPILGDEAPLTVITSDGRKKSTDFWEAPDYADVLECMSSNWAS